MNPLLKYLIYPAGAILALVILICAPLFVLTVAGILFLLSLARSMYREDARREDARRADASETARVASKNGV